MEVGPSATSTE